MHQKPLVGRAPPGPTGELTALPSLIPWLDWGGPREGWMTGEGKGIERTDKGMR